MLLNQLHPVHLLLLLAATAAFFFLSCWAVTMGCSFYRHVKAIKRLEELVTIKRAIGERINHFLNFSGNRIAPDKIGVIEDGAEEPFIYYFGNNRVEASLLKGYTGGSSGRAWVAV
jgi:hypothetical protein